MIIFCNMIGFYGMYLFLGFYFQDVFIGGNIVVGLFIMIYGIGFFMSIIIGKVVDCIGKMCFFFIVLGVISVLLVCLVYVLVLMILLIVSLFIWGLM